jgi:hypothetical protein
MRFWLLILPFLFLSFNASAFTDDGTWQDGYWHKVNGSVNYGGPTKSEACKRYNPDWIHHSAWDRCVNPNDLYNGAASYVTSVCTESTYSSYPWSGCGIYPDPADCSEFQTQNPDPVSMTFTSGYTMEGCYDGCTVVDSGGVSLLGSDGSYTGQYQLTGGDCNGGYQSGLGTQEIIDFYAHDSELQNCYDSTGRLIGQISAELTCPTLDVCYDSSTGEPLGTTSSSTSCDSGVKYNELDETLQAVNVQSTTTETLNPDGSSTTVTETVETQEGLDGSTVTDSTTTTTDKDSSGNVTGESTTTTSETKNQSSYCEVNPNDPLCSLAENLNQDNGSASLSGDCNTPPSCSGDPIACANLKLQWDDYCANVPASESDFESWKSEQTTIDKFGVDTDSNGVLESLDFGEIDVNDSLGLNELGDNGSVGSCPAPHGLGILGTVIEFHYDTICEYADSVRPLIILASIFICMVMVRRVIVGA